MSGVECPWPDAPLEVGLRPGEIHLWCAWLDVPQAVENMLATLSADERQRAARFATELLRNRFVVGRGMLRTILAKYLAVEPRELAFQYSDYGKPARRPGICAACTSTFRTVLGWACWRWLIARWEPTWNAFDRSPTCPSWLSDALPRRRRHGGGNCRWRRSPRPSSCAWTRKEAWLKAVGSGFSFPLEEVGVTFAPGEPARVLLVRGAAAEAAGWWLDSCEPAPGHVAAAAVHGMLASVSRWRWAPRV